MTYYRLKGYYRFIGGNVLKIGFFYSLVIVACVLIGKFLIDLNLMYDQVIDVYSTPSILVIFFVSESILGCIPPDLFMMWAGKFELPVAMLTLLGILSYVGGLISYKIGLLISRNAKVKSFVENRLQKYIRLTKKWGGAFITIAALFPFSPYATVVLAVSLLKYPFNKLLVYGLFRIVRFTVQGMVLIKALDLGI
jgi:membrane protein YqaA with SNARE-associated domain